MNKETKSFIATNLNQDVHQLALQVSRYPLVDMPLAIRQIAGRQKTRTKLARYYHAEEILYPVQLSLEQSSSDITATYKSTLCHGNALADLTGGFGVDCCFMASQFNQVTYVERQAELCNLAKHNFKILGENHISVINDQAENYLLRMKPVDWIFIDPARRSTNGKKVVLLSDCEPDVGTLSNILLEKANKVMIKLSPMMDISAAVRELPQTAEIHIIAIENECKEILLILQKDTPKKVQVHTLNVGKNNQQTTFNFDTEEERTANSTFTSELGKYLYEPNAVVMKSGAFKLMGSRFRLNKLHINTHLYTSNELILEFPGRIFEVKKMWGNSKLEMKNLLTQLPKANISTRNYPISVEELRKKLKIKEGGNSYLFACTLANDQKVIVETIKASPKTQNHP